MDDSEENSIKMSEILVALDHSQYSRAALESAAAIAELMEAKIHGLFVHDDQWLRISKLPSLSEIDVLTGRISPMGREGVEKQIRYLEKAIREHFELISRQHQLTHAWSTVKGSVAEKVLEMAKDADIITIGSKGRSYSKSRKLGRTAMAIIRASEKPVMILQNRNKPGSPPVAVFDGSRKSASGIKIASGIAEKNHTILTVIDLSEAFPSGDNEREEEKRLPEISGVDVNVLKLSQPNMGRFLFLINKLHGGLLVLPKNQRFINRTALEHILESADCPVLLVA